MATNSKTSILFFMSAGDQVSIQVERIIRDLIKEGYKIEILDTSENIKLVEKLKLPTVPVLLIRYKGYADDAFRWICSTSKEQNKKFLERELEGIFS